MDRFRSLQIDSFAGVSFKLVVTDQPVAADYIFIKHEEDNVQNTDAHYIENETLIVKNVGEIDIAPIKNISENRIFVEVPIIGEVQLKDNKQNGVTATKTLRSGSQKQSKVEKNPVNKKELDIIKCDYCRKVFLRLFSLTKHVHIKHPDQIIPTRCDLCKTTFQYKAILQRHIREVHSDNTKQSITCMVCSKTFIFDDNEDGCNCAKDKKQNKRVRKLKSSKQSKISTIKTKESKKTEVKIKEKKNSVSEDKCECTLMYPTAKVSDEHIQLYHRDTMGTCFKCDRIFINEEELNNHLPICSSVQGIDPLCMEVTCDES